MSQPVASVIIPCYNMGRYIGDALDSLQAQTFKDFEIIIVDDGSTDPVTAGKLKFIKQSDPQIKVIRQTNQGLAEARNTGVRQASGQFITCLDADDMFEPSYLEETVTKLRQADRQVGVVSTWLQEFGNREDIWRSGEFNVIDLLTNNQIHAASLFRRSAWEEAGGYKVAMKDGYEDWEFWLSLVELGYRWELVPKPLFRYRIRSGSMLTRTRAAHAQNFTQLFELHEAFFQRHARDLLLSNAFKLQDLHDVIGAKNAALDELQLRIDRYLNYLKRLRLMPVYRAFKQLRQLVWKFRHYQSRKGAK